MPFVWANYQTLRDLYRRICNNYAFRICCSGTTWDWTTEKPTEVEVTNVCPNCGPQSSLISTQNSRELITLQAELETTKAELERAKSRIESMTKSLHHVPTQKYSIF